MQTHYIKFLTEADRARGFLELAKRAHIGSLPGRVYQVPREALPILEQMQISLSPRHGCGGDGCP